MKNIKSLLTFEDYSPDEIWKLIKYSIYFKKIRKNSIKQTQELRSKTIGIIFEKPSTRTRASFATAVYEMGGFPLIYNWNELQLGRGEPIKDTARVLSRYHDLLAARVYSHDTLIELEKYSSVPVVNLLSDKYHPLQALADYMTIYENKRRIKGLNLVFIGDGRDNVFNSLAIVGAKLGVNIRLVTHSDYLPTPSFEKYIRSITRGNFEIYTEPKLALKDADVIYTDVYVSMGQERERKKRLRDFLPKYQVNQELLSLVEKDHYIFMHCLPAIRGEEVVDEVIESKYSVVFDQAENRLHTSKAVLYYLLGGKNV